MSERELVYIVDDDEGVRHSTAALIETLGVEVRACASAEAFFDEPRHKQCACLILDVRMPGMSGLKLQAFLQKNDCITPVIFITGYSDVSTAVQAMRAGAIDFFPKPFPHQAMLDRVQEALGRHRKLKRESRQRSLVEARLSLLTLRERQVMHMAIDGYANKQIAERLGISIRTIEDHRASILKKTRAQSMVQLTSLILGRQLAEED